MRLAPAVLLVSLAACQWSELVNPTPPKPEAKKCYLNLSVVRRVTISSGDSTWTVTDTTWLGTTEVACAPPKP